MYQFKNNPAFGIVLEEPYCNKAAHDYLVNHPSIKAVRELIGTSEMTTATSHGKPIT